MKILHVDTEKSWRGGQQQAVYLYEAMIKKGIDSGFVCPKKTKTYQYLREKNLPVYPLSFLGEWDFIHGISLAKLAKKNQYRILHLHSGHALSWGLWAKLFLPSLKLIAVRRVDFSINKNPFSRIKYNNSLLDMIVAISNNIQQVLKTDGIPEEKISIIHSGIDLKKYHNVEVPFDFRRKWHIPEDAIIIGTIAAFVGHKDYPTLIQAASIVVKQCPEAYFIAVGSGELYKHIRTLAEQSGLAKNFVFTGFQKEVGVFLKSFDIFVISSKLEGLGTSVLDAQAAGIPVIGTRAGGIPEMIENEINGLLVYPQCPERMAEAIIRLVSDKDLREKLSKKSLETVQKFSIENTVEKNIALYKELSIERD